MVRDQAPQLDITTESDSGDSGGLGDSVSLSKLDPCRCPDTHETPDGKCDKFLPEAHGKNRIRCDGCQRDGGWIHKGTKSKKDAPPVGVTVNLGGAKGPKLDETQTKVRDAALAWLGMVEVVFRSTGDNTCADALKGTAPQVAQQLAVLSKFHPIIAKILAPVEATGEALAWVSLSMALTPFILAVLVHHNVIKEEDARKVGIFTAMGSVIGGDPSGVASDEAA